MLETVIIILSNLLFFLLGRRSNRLDVGSVVPPEIKNKIMKRIHQDHVTFHNPLKRSQEKELLKDIQDVD